MRTEECKNDVSLQVTVANLRFALVSLSINFCSIAYLSKSPYPISEPPHYSFPQQGDQQPNLLAGSKFPHSHIVCYHRILRSSPIWHIVKRHLRHIRAIRIEQQRSALRPNRQIVYMSIRCSLRLPSQSHIRQRHFQRLHNLWQIALLSTPLTAIQVSGLASQTRPGLPIYV